MNYLLIPFGARDELGLDGSKLCLFLTPKFKRRKLIGKFLLSPSGEKNGGLSGKGNRPGKKKTAEVLGYAKERMQQRTKWWLWGHGGTRRSEKKVEI